MATIKVEVATEAAGRRFTLILPPLVTRVNVFVSVMQTGAVAF